MADIYVSKGYVAITFNSSFGGENGGKTRNMASPQFFTEDYSAAVDYLGLQDFVDREKSVLSESADFPACTYLSRDRYESMA